MTEISDDENNGGTKITTAHKSHKNTRRSDRIQEKTKQQALERAHIVDEARRKNTHDAKSLGLKKLGMMDLTFN